MQQVQAGSYQPERSALAWVEFCVEAHLAQVKQRLRQIEQAEVTPPTASGDSRRLLDAGFATQEGEGRSTRYVASDDLRALIGRAGSPEAAQTRC